MSPGLHSDIDFKPDSCYMSATCGIIHLKSGRIQQLCTVFQWWETQTRYQRHKIINLNFSPRAWNFLVVSSGNNIWRHKKSWVMLHHHARRHMNLTADMFMGSCMSGDDDQQEMLWHKVALLCQSIQQEVPTSDHAELLGSCRAPLISYTSVTHILKTYVDWCNISQTLKRFLPWNMYYSVKWKKAGGSGWHPGLYEQLLFSPSLVMFRKTLWFGLRKDPFINTC